MIIKKYNIYHVISNDKIIIKTKKEKKKTWYENVCFYWEHLYDSDPAPIWSDEVTNSACFALTQYYQIKHR